MQLSLKQYLLSCFPPTPTLWWLLSSKSNTIKWRGNNFICELHQILQKIKKLLLAIGLGGGGGGCVSELWGTEDSAILSEARKLANNSAYQNGTFKGEGGEAHLLAIKVEAHLELRKRMAYFIACIHNSTPREIQY